MSAKGWAWALPHYFPYCLTPEAEYNRMETEFLIYNLECGDKYKDDMRARLSEFTVLQIRCLIRFIEYLDVHLWWSEYCPEDVRRALDFVRGLEVQS